MTYDVVFIGEKRLGKTSVLASMVNSFKRIGTGFQVKPANKLTEDIMREKIIELKKAFDDADANGDIYFDTEETATKSFDKLSYLISYSEGGYEQPIADLVFHDVPGGLFDNKQVNDQDTADFSTQYEKLQNLIDEADILVFAIDSPLLMEENGKFFTYATKPDELSIRIASCMKTGKVRTILFVPLKCEKYFKAHQMEELSEKVKQYYRPVIEKFGNEPFKSTTTIAITPILTMGNMVFQDFERGQNGKVLMNIQTRRPQKTYFKAVGRFEPKYCEQPLLYVFDLMVKAGQYRNKLYVKQGGAKSSTEESLDKWLAMNIGKGSPDKAVAAAALYGVGKAFFLAKRGITYAYRKNQYNKNPFNQLELQPKKSGEGYSVIQSPSGL